MSVLTVRDLDPQIEAKLRARAARRGRSLEAEVRQILADAVAAEELPPSLADSILHHFAGLEVEPESPGRAFTAQRDIDL